MIGKAPDPDKRGVLVGGLLAYLYGPGRAEEHQDPHLVGSWDGQVAEILEGLEPPIGDDGRFQIGRLARLLEQPLSAVLPPGVPLERPVYHVPVRAAPGDRRLTDAEWGQLAADLMHRTGLAKTGDDGGCRWVAVRHADDHIHLVVMLARQDGRKVSTWNDRYRIREACLAAEQRWGLISTAPADRTAAKRPARAEEEKAARAGRRAPSRVLLRQAVAAAAGAAVSTDEFFEQLRAAGLLVRPRLSDRNPGEITGYSVALARDTDPTGAPVWYGGGKLAPDLSYPKLQQRWGPAPVHDHSPIAGADAAGDSADRAAATSTVADQPEGEQARSSRPRRDGWNAQGPRVVRPALSPQERAAAFEAARRAAEQAADSIRRLAATNPGAAADAAAAAADTLNVAARMLDGPGRRATGEPTSPGVLTEAAESYDRAWRQPWRRRPALSPQGRALRRAAQLLAAAGPATRDDTRSLLTLLAALAALTDAVGELRDAQQRAAQAAAARRSGEQLRAAARALSPAGVGQPAGPTASNTPDAHRSDPRRGRSRPPSGGPALGR